MEQQESFLIELDGMIEATEEFIADDVLSQSATHNEREQLDLMFRDESNKGRVEDLLALEHVRELFTSTFQNKEN